MAVERAGSVYFGSIYSTTLSCTVPADAEIAIAFGKDYAEPTGVPLLGSSSMTLIARQGDNSNRPPVSMYYLLSPPAGSQTLYTRSTEGFSDTYYHAIAFYKGIDTGAPIEDFDAQTTDITGMTYSAGGMMVGCIGQSYISPTVTDNSQTQLFLDTGHGFGGAQRADIGDFYWTATSGRAVAITLKAAAGGAATSLVIPSRSAIQSILSR